MHTRSFLPLLAVIVTACPDDEGAMSADAVDVSDVVATDADVDTAQPPDVSPDGAEATTAETAEDVTVETADDVASETADDVASETADDGIDADVGPVCDVPCDCPQGERCEDGACVLGAEPVFCCDNAACPAGAACVDDESDAGLCGVATSAHFGAIVFNEVLVDGVADGDPNEDGDVDAVEDEFVELVNASVTAIDLGGFTLRETTLPDLPRHTFAAGDVLGPGNALVVFGGGTAPDDVPGARFVVANADDPGIPFGLSLDDAGDTLELRDAAGALVALFAWGPSAPLPALSDESWTRSPDLTGDFAPHTTAAPSRTFSPGRRSDGAAF